MLATFILSTVMFTNAATIVPPHREDDSREVRVMADKPKEVDPTEFKEAVDKLHDLKIIDEKQYWIDNAQPGRIVESSKVQEVIIATARTFEPVDSVEEALNVLQKNKAFSNIGFWRSMTEKPKVQGGLAAFLVITLAKTVK